MKVDEKGHTVIIRDTKKDIRAFRENIEAEYNSFKDRNMVLDITHDEDVALEDVLSFMPLAAKHRKAKKSFVIVVSDFDFNDIIEMEEIERDLGF